MKPSKPQVPEHPFVAERDFPTLDAEPVLGRASSRDPGASCPSPEGEGGCRGSKQHPASQAHQWRVGRGGNRVVAHGGAGFTQARAGRVPWRSRIPPSAGTDTAASADGRSRKHGWRNTKGARAGVGDGDAQFLVQLADQTGFRGLTRLDLAARKIPTGRPVACPSGRLAISTRPSMSTQGAGGGRARSWSRAASRSGKDCSALTGRNGSRQSPGKESCPHLKFSKQLQYAIPVEWAWGGFVK